MKKTTNTADRADVLEVKCSLLEAALAEQQLNAARSAHKAKLDTFKAKYNMGDADQLNLETCEITRITAGPKAE